MRGRKIHPIRGIFGGILFGLGLALILISLGVVTFGTNAPFVVFVIAFLAVLAWSIFGPARKSKGGTDEPAPAT
jgi:hypothetical protein